MPIAKPGIQEDVFVLDIVDVADGEIEQKELWIEALKQVAGEHRMFVINQ